MVSYNCKPSTEKSEGDINEMCIRDRNTVEGNRLRLNNTSNKAEAIGNVKIVYVPKPVEKKENVTADENAALQMAKAPVEVA